MRVFSLDRSMPTKKPTDKIQKTRIEDAEVTEISLVPAGAVEDADYVVLSKEAPCDDDEDLLAKSVDAVLLGRESLSEEQVTQLLEVLVPEGLSKADTEEESEEEDSMETSEEDSDEESDMEKKCGGTHMAKSIDERLEALESGLQDLLAKINPPPDEVIESEVAKEADTSDEIIETEDPLAGACRILHERELAKQRDTAASSQARLLAALENLVSKVDSVGNGLTEAERKLARACGQDA